MATTTSTTNGRVPPHDVEAEEALLGAMLLAPRATEAAAGVVRADDFYKPAHANLYDVVTTLYGDGEPTDPVTVAAALRARGWLDDLGGTAALSSLQAGAPSTTNAGTYARIIAEHARRRRLLGIAAEISESAYAQDDDGLERAVAMLADVPDVGRVRLEVEDVSLAVAGLEEPVLPTLLELG